MQSEICTLQTNIEYFKKEDIDNYYTIEKNKTMVANPGHVTIYAAYMTFDDVILCTVLALKAFIFWGQDAIIFCILGKYFAEYLGIS